MTTTERPLSLSERMWDATARVERIVHFEAMLTEPDRDFCEWIIDSLEKPIKETLGWTDEQWKGVVELFDEDREEFASTLARRLTGWVVEISTPVPSGMDRGFVRFSWGYYETARFMADTYDEALEKAISWVEAQWDAAHAEAKRNKPTAG